MIRKNKRQATKEAIINQKYIIPDCNKRKPEKLLKLRNSMDKLIDVDPFVPAWPWEMQL